MDRYTKLYIALAMYTVILVGATSLFWVNVLHRTERMVEVIELPCESEKIDPLTLLNAMIIKESKGENNAIGSKNDVGVLQITPIMLKEANNIVGYERWKLIDRFSREASVQIWLTVMEAKNPEYDLHKACKIWNPRAGIYYHNEVERIYKQLLEDEKETITKGNS